MRRAQHSVTGTEAVEILVLETFREEALTIAAQIWLVGVMASCYSDEI